MKKSITIVALLAAVSFSADAADIVAGKTKAEAQCVACHAQNGDWNKPLDASYPKLAGQHEDYLVQVLRQYQNGQRNNAVMAGMAASLSQDEIHNLAAYFSSLKGDLYLKK